MGCLIGYPGFVRFCVRDRGDRSEEQQRGRTEHCGATCDGASQCGPFHFVDRVPPPWEHTDTAHGLVVSRSQSTMTIWVRTRYSHPLHEQTALTPTDNSTVPADRETDRRAQCVNQWLVNLQCGRGFRHRHRHRKRDLPRRGCLRPEYPDSRFHRRSPVPGSLRCNWVLRCCWSRW